MIAFISALKKKLFQEKILGKKSFKPKIYFWSTLAFFCSQNKAMKLWQSLYNQLERGWNKFLFGKSRIKNTKVGFKEEFFSNWKPTTRLVEFSAFYLNNSFWDFSTALPCFLDERLVLQPSRLVSGLKRWNNNTNFFCKMTR